MAAERTHRRVRSCRELRVEALPEDDPVIAEEEQRIDVLRVQLVAPSRRRSHDPNPHLRVEGLRGAL